MITAIDTSVLAYLFSRDFALARKSDLALHRALDAGELIVSDVALAELGPTLEDQSLDEFLDDWRIRFVPGTLEVAEIAGRNYSLYLARGGKRGRVVPDFMIGAHAMVLADCLLTADSGFERDYFAGLKTVRP
jgi:hypothetical protein